VTPLIFLDTETTGLCPDIHAPWEIAWRTAIHSNNELIRVAGFRAYIDLSADTILCANDKALTIGRFADRYGIDSSLMSSADMLAWLQQDIARVMARCKTTDVPHLVGAVPSFDHTMLCMNHIGWPDFGEGLWHYHLIDVETLAAGKLKIPPPYSSSVLTAALGVTVDDDTKHTAMGDVDWAIQLYAAVYELEVV
jgi:hypothetical protein